MRRWLLWLLMAIVLLTGVFVAALVFIPPAPPFRFLDGKRPLRLRPPKSIASDLERAGITQLVYSFSADYDSFIASAHEELNSKEFERLGFASFERRPGETYLKPGFLARRRRSSGSTTPQQPVQLAVFFRDVRMPDVDKELSVMQTGKAKDWEERKGWISLIVRIHRSPSLIDRFRDWLGL